MNDKGCVIAVYATIASASLSTGVKIWNISDACRGLQKTAGGYLWRYVE